MKKAPDPGSGSATLEFSYTYNVQKVSDFPVPNQNVNKFLQCTVSAVNIQFVQLSARNKYEILKGNPEEVERKLDIYMCTILWGGGGGRWVFTYLNNGFKMLAVQD